MVIEAASPQDFFARHCITEWITFGTEPCNPLVVVYGVGRYCRNTRLKWNRSRLELRKKERSRMNESLMIVGVRVVETT